MASAVGLRADYSAAELRRLAASDEKRKQEPPAPVFGWGPGRYEPDGGSPDWWHGPADAARLGPSVQRAWPRGSSGQLVQGSRAAPLERAAGRGSRTRLNRAGPGHPRCGALASDRPAARHSRAVRDRLPRAHNWQAPEGARLLPYQRPPAPPGAGSAHDRGV